MRLIKSTILFLSFFCFPLIAQTGSVELRDGLGTLVSSHASIQEAYTAIPNPVTQAYVIEILSTYTGANESYPITFNLRAGTSATNTVTLRPAAGNTGETVSAAASGQPILLLDDADFVTVDGRPGGVGTTSDLKFENLGTTSGSYTFRFLNGATNNVIKYCQIYNSTQNLAGPRAIEVGTSASNPTGNSDNTIMNNDIVGGRSGIGFAGTTANPNLNNSVIDNKISNFGYAGIWVLSSSHSVSIVGNDIFQTTGYNTINFGIIAASFTTSLDVVNNNIYDIQNTAATTLRGMQITPGAGSIVNIINNFVSLMLDNGTKTSIYAIQILGTADHTCNIYYNSIRLGGTHTGGTAGVVVSGGIVKGNTGAASIYNQKNNIVLNTRTGGTSGTFHTCSFNGSTNLVGTYEFDYNVYYGADATSFHAGWNGTLYSDLAQYKTAATPHEQNSIFKAVNYLSNTDLHLTGTSVGDFDLAGLPIAGITTDIDGQARHTSFPYRGADEGDVPLPVELSSFTAVVTANSVTLDWLTVSEKNNYGFEIERKQTEQSWQRIGFVPGSGTTTQNRKYSFVDNDLLPGSYNYRIKQLDLDGSVKYFDLAETVEIGIPAEFDLSQNYPNPFNPATLIKYSIAKESLVKLAVFNNIGQHVASLVDQVMQPGKYSVTFDGTSFASGVYYYKLSAGNFTEIKKMILIK